MRRAMALRQDSTSLNENVEAVSNLVAALVSNPSAVATVAAAFIAATVALLVMSATQYLTFKKARTDALLPKLEQLYLLLNELSEKNAADFKTLYLGVQGDAEARRAIAEMDDLDLYGHRRAKKIIMFIRLYFPSLASAHQRVFAAERHLNDLKHDLGTTHPPSVDELIEAAGLVGHCLMLMEKELIRNRDHLLEQNLLPKRYRPATPAEVAAVRPPPTGPIMGNQPIRDTAGPSETPAPA